MSLHRLIRLRFWLPFWFIFLFVSFYNYDLVLIVICLVLITVFTSHNKNHLFISFFITGKSTLSIEIYLHIVPSCLNLVIKIRSKRFVFVCRNLALTSSLSSSSLALAFFVFLSWGPKQVTLVYKPFLILSTITFIKIDSPAVACASVP